MPDGRCSPGTEPRSAADPWPAVGASLAPGAPCLSPCWVPQRTHFVRPSPESLNRRGEERGSAVGGTPAAEAPGRTSIAGGCSLSAEGSLWGDRPSSPLFQLHRWKVGGVAANWPDPTAPPATELRLLIISKIAMLFSVFLSVSHYAPVKCIEIDILKNADKLESVRNMWAEEKDGWRRGGTGASCSQDGLGGTDGADVPFSPRSTGGSRVAGPPATGSAREPQYLGVGLR